MTVHLIIILLINPSALLYVMQLHKYVLKHAVKMSSALFVSPMCVMITLLFYNLIAFYYDVECNTDGQS